MNKKAGKKLNKVEVSSEYEEIKITEKDLEEKLGSDAYLNLVEVVSDLISDKTGFCHKGFVFEIKVSAELDFED